MTYYSYSDFLKKRFGEKVYKLPIKLPITCPNRDGRLGYKGCSFCDDAGGSFENIEGSIRDQLLKNKSYIGKRYGAKKFISYFQNYTNTYMDLNSFKDIINQSIIEDIVGINISTRPDCIYEGHLEFLNSISNDYMITLEMGLQTANYRTLQKLNRAHGLSEFIDAAIRIKKYNLRICAHVMLGLPWDDEIDVLETARIINALSVDEVKIHALYIMPNTAMGELYKKNLISTISLEEYKRLVILFLRNLNSNIVVERIIGRAPKSALFCNWNTSWWKIRDDIINIMNDNNFSQGDLERKRNDQIYFRG